MKSVLRVACSLLISLTAHSASWIQPQKGWLYVLDVDDRTAPQVSRILVVDPVVGKVVEALPLEGYQLQFTLSKDGKYIYVTTGVSGQGELSMVSTSSGQVMRSVGLPDRLLHTLLPQTPSMVASSDGKWILVATRLTMTAGADSYAVSILKANDIVNEHSMILPGNCGVPSFIPASNKWSFIAICPNANTVRQVALTEDGTASKVVDYLVPSNSDFRKGPRVAAGSIASDGKLGLILNDGHAVSGSQTIVEISNHSSTSPRWIPFQQGAKDEDGFWYVGSAPVESDRNAEVKNEVDVVDLHSGKQVFALPMPVPFLSLDLSADKTTLYAVSPAAATITAIDVTNKLFLKVREVISNVGHKPVFCISVP